MSYPQSPKAVLGNRFIVVDLSETNLVDVDPHYQDPEETADAARAAATANAEADAAATAATAAAAARAARKKANDKLIVSCFSLVWVRFLLSCPACAWMVVLYGTRMMMFDQPSVRGSRTAIFCCWLRWSLGLESTT